MTTQRQLFDPMLASTRTRQPDLFAACIVGTGISCSECGTELVETESGYACCPKGHGRLLLVVAQQESGSWFEDDDTQPEDDR